MGEPRIEAISWQLLNQHPDPLYWVQRWMDEHERAEKWKWWFAGSAIAHVILVIRELGRGLGWW